MILYNIILVMQNFTWRASCHLYGADDLARISIESSVSNIYVNLNQMNIEKNIFIYIYLTRWVMWVC